MSYGTLALIVACGLIGPVAARIPRLSIPIVVGEITAGVVIGNTGFGLVNTSNATLAFLSQTGFALLMLVVGTHLPLREPGLRSALGRGLGAVAVSFVLALPCAYGLARLVHAHHFGLFVLLLATSSAAVAMPIIHDAGLAGPDAVMATAWIALADIATIVALPIVFAAGSLVRVGFGVVTVAAIAAALLVLGRYLLRFKQVRAVRRASRQRGWALDLRISLLALFVLAYTAERFGVSVLVAGFCAGAVLAVLGEPRRLAWQLIGVGEGFFIPLFFVTLGAKLQFRRLFDQPRNLVLLAALVLLICGVHLAVAMIWRLRPAIGLLATAQMGVPAAVASLAISRGYLRPGQAAAVITAAMASLAMSALGASRMRHDAPHGESTTAPSLAPMPAANRRSDAG